MSSVDKNEENDNCSNGSKNSGISNTGCLKKFKRSNISIKDFKIMLVNGLSKAKKEATLTTGSKQDDKFSAVCNSTSVDNDKIVDDNNESLINNKTTSTDGNQNHNTVPTEGEFEIDDKGSIDENSFELRIDNDDEDEIPEIKFDPEIDQNNENTKSCKVSVQDKNNGDEHSRQTSMLNSEKALCRSYLSNDLENINIPEAFNNNDSDDKVEKLTIPNSTTGDSKQSSSPAVSTDQTKFNCAFCEKTFPSKNSLKFHVLSHLKSFLKQDAKNNILASTSEVENTTLESIDGNGSTDFVCVLCDKSFTNKKILTEHYKVNHQVKGFAQIQNRQLAMSSTSVVHGVRRQSNENKISSALTTPSSITSTTEESSTNADENGCNEDASKQYKCYICDKQFARNSSLMWHIQFHETYMYSKLKKNNTELENGLSPGGGGTGVEPFSADADQPFRCQVCGKTYESLSGYRRHVANHGIADDEEPTAVIGLGEKCELCNKYYPTAVGLKRHIIFMHKEQLPVTPTEDTDDVGAADNVVEDGDDSISSSSVSDEYICNICDRPFTHRNSYKRHMNVIHRMSGDEVSTPRQNISGVKCESCGKYFSTSSNMRKHAQKYCKRGLVEEDDDGGEFVCDICNRSFCSQRACSIHRAHQHRAELNDIPIDAYVEKEDGGFQCTVCDKVFDSRKGVIRHIGYHRSALNARVDVNNTNEESASDDNEDDEDEEEESIPCPICGKTFRSVRGMRIHAFSHRESVHNDEDNGEDEDEDGDGDNGDDDSDEEVAESCYECNICSETFEGFRSFKVHIGWHRRRGEEAVKSVRGTNAGKSARSGSSKIHQCQYCPRWYNTQQALAGHMKAHQPQKVVAGSEQARPPTTGGKTGKGHMCQVCGQHFPSGSSLSGHMKLHLGEGMTTPTTSSGQPLTLEDTMECDMCGKFFMRKQDMAKHMRDHMSGAVTKENIDLNLFRCIYCHKSFVGRKSLNTHQILHEEAQLALKRAAADQLQPGASPAKQRRLNESTAAAPEELIGWDEVIQAHQCDECDRRLSTKQSLRRHIEWHARMRMTNGPSAPPSREANSTAMGPPPPLSKESAGMPFECLYCKKCFSSKQLLVEHTTIHEDARDDGPHTVVVNDLEALGEHAVVQCVEGGNEEYFVFEQRDGEAYQCSECDETHFDKLQMIVHMAYHVGKRWANGRQRALIIKVDPIMMAPFECMFCDERFVNKLFRSRHVVKRHGNSVLQCDSCKKLFLSKKKLALHCRIHLADSVYRCQHCLKCFASKWFLKRHARKKCAAKSSPEKKEMMLPKILSSSESSPPSAHVPEDHKCEFCGLLVNDKEAFLGHLQSHVFKYKCENCDFRCENILEFESHACIVTTTETVACTQCDNVFADSAELEAHRQTLHDGTVLCDVCSELFTNENDLRSHKRTNHQLFLKDVG